MNAASAHAGQQSRPPGASAGQPGQESRQQVVAVTVTADRPGYPLDQSRQARHPPKVDRRLRRTGRGQADRPGISQQGAGSDRLPGGLRMRCRAGLVGFPRREAVTKSRSARITPRHAVIIVLRRRGEDLTVAPGAPPERGSHRMTVRISPTTWTPLWNRTVDLLLTMDQQGDGQSAAQALTSQDASPG